MKLTRALVALCLMVCVSLAQAASAPAHILGELSSAKLSGQGNYRWFGLKIYQATLWVGESGYQQASPNSAKFVLDLNYARDLVGERIAQASIDEIRQLKIGTAAQQTAWFDEMKKIFPDVHEGTHISGVFLPEQGARFYLDGKLLGEIKDAEFAHAFFAIWLDPRTSAAGLRSELLSRKP